MRYQALAVVAGIASFQFVPRMPHPLLYAAIVPVLVFLLYSPRWRLVAYGGAGFLWAMWRADLILGARLDPAQAGRVMTVAGVVDSRPIDFGAGLRFDFKARSVTGAAGRVLA
ncbi:MAG TPA: hypothetical protein QF901_14720 [Gammaproteobacteria bacterium]|jgi:competence protein ComEC|nr:hypothetical protein [Gammaproteobacteria bacterium]